MSARARRLGTAALGAVAFFFLVFVQLPLFFGRFPHAPATLDLLNYLTAAEVGLRHGWSHIYAPQLQAPVFMAISGASHFEWLDMFVSPPPVAWLAVPLTVMPLDAAYWTWTAVSVAALLVAAWRVAPWQGGGRVVALLVGFGMYPVLIAVQFGQVTTLLAAAVALAWDALRRDRQTLAGLLLVLVALKPQVGVFIPFALLLAGYRRTFAVWVAGAALLAAVSLATLGVTGVSDLVRDLAEEQRHLDNEVWTLAWLTGPGVVAVALEGLCVIAGMAAAWLVRGRRSPGLPVVVGALASLLGAGYHHSIDFPSVMVLVLVQIHSLRGWPAAGLVVAGVASSVLIPRFGPGPVLVFLIAWLALAVAQAAAPRLEAALGGRRAAPAAVPAQPPLR